MKTTLGVVIAAAAMMFGAGLANAAVSGNVAALRSLSATIVNDTDRRLCSPSRSSSPLLVEPPRPSLQVVLVEIKVRRGGAALLSIRRRFPGFVFFLSLASAS